MLLPKSIAALLHIATFASLASAADKLAFKSPDISSLKKAASGYPYLTIGSEVKISWSTDFEQTTLAVYQKVNGNVFVKLIADSNRPDNTSATWKAYGINGHPLKGALFHFYLENSANFNCDGCYLNTEQFQLTLGPDDVSSSQSSSTTTKSSATNNPTSSASAGPGAAAAGSSQSGSSSNNLSVPLGVGLGAGGFVLLAIVGIFFMWFHRRRKQRQEAATEVGAYDETSSTSTPQMKQNNDRFSRESGALGPYMANPSPNWEQQEAQQREQQSVWQQQQQQQQEEAWDHDQWQPPPRNPGRLSQGYIPFAPVMATHPERRSAESSRHSWIDQFDFERPGYQEEDEISEIRRSIHVSPQERPDVYAPSSHASIGDVWEIPQVPQSVYHSYPDENWPLQH